MGREEDFPKFVLKINGLCGCQGCLIKVKKVLGKIEGINRFTTYPEERKVIVSGNVDPLIPIKKLKKKFKNVELLPYEGGNNKPSKQFQNMQIEDEEVQKDVKSHKNGKDEKNQQPRQKQNQLMKKIGELKDLKLPQLKDLKMPLKKKKSVQFNLPENDGDCSEGDSCDWKDVDGGGLDENFDIEQEDLKAPLKKKAMNSTEMNHVMNDKTGGGGKNGRKGSADGDVHVQNKGMSGQEVTKNGKDGKKGGGRQNQDGIAKNSRPQNNKTGGNGGKKSDGNNGGGQNQDDVAKNSGPQNSKNRGNGGKKSGGNNGGEQNQGEDGEVAKHGRSHPQDNNGNGVNGDSGNNETATVGNGGEKNNFPARDKKGGGGAKKGVLNMDLSGGVGNVGHMGNVPMGQFPAVPTLPTMNVGMYFQGAGSEILPSNPYHQQYMAAMMQQQQMMMQQQQMMQQQNWAYAAPFPAAYMPSPHQPQEPFTNYFSDENANGCTIM